jgi:hypothetical protein
MTNTALWQKFETTDPKTTKGFNRSGGFKGTAINATSIQKKLTEEFGPCGMGWRFVLEDDRVEEGHKLKSGDPCKLHIVRGHLDYCVSDKWYSTGPQFGQTYLVGEYSSGTYTDEEAPKKSITDCIGKCAATLGIGADIYLGLFDDNKYVNDATKRDEPTKLEKAAAKPRQPSAPRSEVRDKWVTYAQTVYSKTSNASDMLAAMGLISNKAREAKIPKDWFDECIMQCEHERERMGKDFADVLKAAQREIGEDWDETKEQAKDVF